MKRHERQVLDAMNEPTPEEDHHFPPLHVDLDEPVHLTCKTCGKQYIYGSKHTCQEQNRDFDCECYYPFEDKDTLVLCDKHRIEVYDEPE